MNTSLGQGSRECGLCPADSFRPWIGPWTRVEFLAQNLESGQNAPRSPRSPGPGLAKHDSVACSSLSECASLVEWSCRNDAVGGLFSARPCGESTRAVQST
eukprot:3574248-Prymnesium_polylepis.1